MFSTPKRPKTIFSSHIEPIISDNIMTFMPDSQGWFLYTKILNPWKTGKHKKHVLDPDAHAYTQSFMKRIGLFDKI